MDMHALESIGLSGNEAKVYVALLKLGSSSASDIVKHSGVHRVLVYEILTRLIEKGLISHVMKQNKRYYEAAQPEELIAYLEKQKRDIEHKEEKIKAFLPELQALYKSAASKQEVHVFKGLRGVMTALDMFFAQKKPVYVFGSTGATRETLRHHFKKYRDYITKNKIPNKMIYYESRRGGDVGFKNSEIRYLPDAYKTPVVVDISGRMVLMMMFTDDLLAILIENQKIADAYMQFFNVMWMMATK